MVSRHTSGGHPLGSMEVLFEFQHLGHILRVVAIDPVTATEVTMIADPKHGRETIKRLAARKLQYVLRKKAAKAAKKDGLDKLV